MTLDHSCRLNTSLDACQSPMSCLRLQEFELIGPVLSFGRLELCTGRRLAAVSWLMKLLVS
jgi:hypothetical protein